MANVEGVAVHVLSAPLEPGAEVEAKVDWERRWDHMAQHSTQHLLTALASKLWGVDTVSWGLASPHCYLELSGCPNFTEDQRAELERAANDAIRAGTRVTPSWHSVQDGGERRSWQANQKGKGGPCENVDLAFLFWLASHLQFTHGNYKRKLR